MKFESPKVFEKLNIRVAKIKGIKNHPKTKDYILDLDLGIVERDCQVVADLAGSYKKDQLIGKSVVYIENIKPIQVQGISSMGIILIAHHNGKPVLLAPQESVATGVQVSGLDTTEHHYHWIAGEHGGE